MNHRKILALLTVVFEQDLMDDPNIVSAIDEETEFTALVVRQPNQRSIPFYLASPYCWLSMRLCTDYCCLGVCGTLVVVGVQEEEEALLESILHGDDDVS